MIAILGLVAIGLAISSDAQDVESRISCEGNSMTLTCDKGEYLTIVGGFYGRRRGDVCKYATPQNCRSSQSLNIMRKKCNDRQTCTLSALNTEFGDPCPYVTKYLEALYTCTKEIHCSDNQYKCKNRKCISKSQVCDGLKDCASGEDENGCSYTTAYACEYAKLKLECRPGELIRVIKGFYGRNSKTICGNSDIVGCSAHGANEVLKNRCNYQRTCTVPAENSIFSDPCSGLKKYIEIQYACWSVPSFD